MAIITCNKTTEVLPVDYAFAMYTQEMRKCDPASEKAQRYTYIVMKLLEGETVIDADTMS